MQNGQGGRTGIAVAGAAAAGLLAGIAVNAGRRVVTQAAEAMTGDWLDALKAEHLMIMELFDEIDATTPGDVGKRKRLAARIKAAIDKHAFEEESVVYPVIRLGESDEVARKLVLEHAEMKTLLYEVESAEPSAPSFMKTINALRRALEEHIREEEDEIFPRLREHLSPEADARVTMMLHKAGVKLA
jgi:iron-sulfur cluster repair protein YtfE (RIC family)